MQTIPEHSATRDNVEGHEVKYSNCNNSAVDCPISLTFGTELAQPAHYKCLRSKAKVTGSKFVTA